MINIHKKHLISLLKNQKVKIKNPPTNININPKHNFPYKQNKLSNHSNSNHIRNIDYKNYNNINIFSNIQNNHHRNKIKIQLKNAKIKSASTHNIKNFKNYNKKNIFDLNYLPPLFSTKINKEIIFNKVKLEENDIIKNYIKLKKSNSADSSLKCHNIDIKSDKLPLISCCNNYNRNQRIRKKILRCVSSYDLSKKKVNDLYLSLGYFPKPKKSKFHLLKKKILLKKDNNNQKEEYKSRFHFKKLNFLINKSLKNIIIDNDKHRFFNDKYARIKSTNKYPLIKIKHKIYNVHSNPNIFVNNLNKDDELLNDKGTYGESFF